MALCYYLTHPQIVVDPNIPVPQWTLSEVGRSRVKAVLGATWMRSIRRIVSSDEQKAKDTAKMIGRHLDISIEILPDFHENDRSATGFLPPQEFENAATDFFKYPDRSFKGWERAIDAQLRIVQAVRAALKDSDCPTLFVGHGGVGTLLKCHLINQAISRDHDQCHPPAAAGGGNLLTFEGAQWVYREGWTALEGAA